MTHHPSVLVGGAEAVLVRDAARPRLAAAPFCPWRLRGSSGLTWTVPLPSRTRPSDPLDLKYRVLELVKVISVGGRAEVWLMAAETG